VAEAYRIGADVGADPDHGASAVEQQHAYAWMAEKARLLVTTYRVAIEAVASDMRDSWTAGRAWVMDGDAISTVIKLTANEAT